MSSGGCFRGLLLNTLGLVLVQLLVTVIARADAYLSSADLLSMLSAVDAAEYTPHGFRHLYVEAAQQLKNFREWSRKHLEQSAGCWSSIRS